MSGDTGEGGQAVAFGGAPVAYAGRHAALFAPASASAGEEASFARASSGAGAASAPPSPLVEDGPALPPLPQPNANDTPRMTRELRTEAAPSNGRSALANAQERDGSAHQALRSKRKSHGLVHPLEGHGRARDGSWLERHGCTQAAASRSPERDGRRIARKRCWIARHRVEPPADAAARERDTPAHPPDAGVLPRDTRAHVRHACV